MSDNVTSLAERYRKQDDSPKTEYKAFAEDKSRTRQARFKVSFADGSIGLFSYSYLAEVYSTSHQYVTLFFHNCMVMIEGRNLTELIDLLQDEKIRELRCYNAKYFMEPPAEDTVILKITRKSLQEVLKESSQ